MKKSKKRIIWVTGYVCKRNNVPRHRRTLNDAGDILTQITNPSIKTIVELSPEADKTLKALIYTLSGSLILSAVIRMRS